MEVTTPQELEGIIDPEIYEETLNVLRGFIERGYRVQFVPSKDGEYMAIEVIPPNK